MCMYFTGNSPRVFAGPDAHLEQLYLCTLYDGDGQTQEGG